MTETPDFSGTTVEPTKEEYTAKLQEMNEQHQNERMERIVVLARERILPFLKEKNLLIDETRLILDTLALVIQQGLFALMRDTKVETLGLREKYSTNYPGYAEVVGLLDLVNPETMEDAIESLQWMSKKIEAVIKEKTKDQKFVDLDVNF